MSPSRINEPRGVHDRWLARDQRDPPGRRFGATCARRNPGTWFDHGRLGDDAGAAAGESPSVRESEMEVSPVGGPPPAPAARPPHGEVRLQNPAHGAANRQNARSSFSDIGSGHGRDARSDDRTSPHEDVSEKRDSANRSTEDARRPRSGSSRAVCCSASGPKQDEQHRASECACAQRVNGQSRSPSDTVNIELRMRRIRSRTARDADPEQMRRHPEQEHKRGCTTTAPVG